MPESCELLLCSSNIFKFYQQFLKILSHFVYDRNILRISNDLMTIVFMIGEFVIYGEHT